jgi:hypothetical protein
MSLEILIMTLSLCFPLDGIKGSAVQTARGRFWDRFGGRFGRKWVLKDPHHHGADKGDRGKQHHGIDLDGGIHGRTSGFKRDATREGDPWFLSLKASRADPWPKGLDLEGKSRFWISDLGGLWLSFPQRAAVITP